MDQFKGVIGFVYIIASIIVLIFVVMALVQIDTHGIAMPVPVLDDAKELNEYKGETAKTVELYKSWSLHENIRIFEWHSRSTKIIFYISMLVSVSGICLSFWQFLQADVSEQRAEHADELEIKNQFLSLAFKSRSIASLLLFMSIGYLLIYVTFVYEISPHEANNRLADMLSDEAGVSGAEDAPVTSAENTDVTTERSQ